MKKISFGSFPFINIDKKTRMCLDKYLIKTFADQIIITDIFSNLNSAKDFFYLTPDIIIDQLYDFDAGQIRTAHVSQSGMVQTRGIIDVTAGRKKFHENTIIPIKTVSKLIIDNEYALYSSNLNLIEESKKGSGKGDKGSDKGSDKSKKSKYPSALYAKLKDPYLDIVKRGFFILRNFYKKISNDPFYRDIVYLPVYSEKLEVLNPIKLTQSQFKYSFFILANDLTKNLRLDEISFNESAVINALYIFTQLFPHKKLTEFDEKDLDKLLRVYKFFEEYRLSPIQFFTLLYRIFYVFANAKTLEEAKAAIIQMSRKAPFNQIFDDAFVRALIDVLESYNSKTFIELIKSIKGTSQSLAIESMRTNQERFWRVIETILNNKNVMSLISDTSRQYADRLRNLNQNFKFRDIIILFEELVKYNKIRANDIIKDTNFNLNFKLELNNEVVAFNEQVIKKKLDETFANFLNDANKYIDNLFQQKLRALNNETSAALHGAAVARREADEQMQRYYQIERELRDIQQQLKNATPGSDEYYNLNQIQNQLMAQLTTLTSQLSNSSLMASIMSNANRELNEKLANQYMNEMIQIEYKIEDLRKRLESTDNPIEQAQINQEILNLSNRYQDLNQKINQLTTSSDYVEKNKGLEFSSSVKLKIAKTELGELYQTLKNFFMNQTMFNIFIKQATLNPDILTYEGMQKFINKNHQSDEEESLAIELKDIDLAMNEVVNIITEQFLQDLEAKSYNKALGRNIANEYFNKLKDIVKNTLLEHHKLKDVIKERFMKILCTRVCKIFATTFKRNLQKGEIAFNETTYGLHPMIKNLLKNPNNFKSFIFGFDELINLYDLLYLTEVEKYLLQSAANQSFTAAQRLPIKLTQIINKFNYVIDVLGIKQNPIWIISRSKIFLSLPDFMSLTQERIFNSIRKENIESYCRIDYSKIWNEMDFGSAFGGKAKEFKDKIKKLEKEISKINKEIEKKEKEKEKANKNKKKELGKEIGKLKAYKDTLMTSLKGLQAAMNLFSIDKNDIKLLSTQDLI